MLRKGSEHRAGIPSWPRSGVPEHKPGLHLAPFPQEETCLTHPKDWFAATLWGDSLMAHT